MHCVNKVLYDEFSKRPEIKPYCPPKLSKGRTLDKTYFFNVISTFFYDEVLAILVHANTLRNSEKEVDEKRESIMMSQEMADLMFKFPYVCKYLITTILTIFCS